MKNTCYYIDSKPTSEDIVRTLSTSKMPKYSFLTYLYIKCVSFWVNFLNIFVCNKLNRKKNTSYFKNIEIKMLIESEKRIKQ